MKKWKRRISNCYVLNIKVYTNRLGNTEFVGRGKVLLLPPPPPNGKIFKKY
jgi:hypothetical protein